MCTCTTAVAHLFQMTTWQTFQRLCESSEVLRLSGSQEPLIFQYVVLFLLISELWEKTAFILTSIDDYSSWNPRFCITSNVTELMCLLWSWGLFGWRVPLQRCDSSGLHPSQRMEVTGRQVCVASSSESDAPVRVVEVSLSLENLKWGNKLLCWFVCWGLAAFRVLLLEVKN